MDYFLTFTEGLLSFVSPCILPMLPIYLSYFAAASSTTGRAKYTVAVNALCFVAGFSLIFILLGALAGTFGVLVSEWLNDIQIVFGVILVLLGLNFAGVITIPLLSRSTQGRFNTKRYGCGASFLMGIFFCAGWIPCVGSFLSAALIAAANSQTVIKGVLLLAVYSLGLGLPLFLSAVLMDYLSNAIRFLKKHHKAISIISGILLIGLGVRMLYQSIAAMI
ncbi:MAG: cytochrome c biogenesis CcdA family protein [Anaerofustis sp.]